MDQIAAGQFSFPSCPQACKITTAKPAYSGQETMTYRLHIIHHCLKWKYTYEPLKNLPSIQKRNLLHYSRKSTDLNIITRVRNDVIK